MTSKEKTPVPATATAFLGRQPIINPQQHIFAYELLYRQHSHNAAQFRNPSLATAQVLVNTFATMGIDNVLGDKIGFINFGRELLENDIIRLLPKQRVILEILEDVEPDADLVARCKVLRAEGYRFVLDDFVHYDCLSPFIDVADMLKLDLTLLDDDYLQEHLRIARRHQLKVVAEKVETQAQFEKCRALGFNFYQGYFFARPVVLEASDIPAFRYRIIRLLNQLMAGVEVMELEGEIARDLGLSYKLLRYINSAGLSALDKTDKIKHALVRLGTQQLYRWLTLLLFAEHGCEQASPLMTIAVQRGALLEALGRGAYPKRGNELFIVGMFSLLEALLRIPLDSVLKELYLPANIQEALLHRQGPYGPYLLLAEAMERCDWARMHQLSRDLGLAQQNLDYAGLEAMLYAQRFA